MVMVMGAVRDWASGDTFTLLSTSAGPASMPLTNLKTPNLLLPWRSGASGVDDGVEFDFNGSDVGVFAIEAMNTNLNTAASGTTFYSMRLSSTDPFDTAFTTVYANTYPLTPSVAFPNSTFFSHDAVRWNILIGFDTLSTDITHTGYPVTSTNKTGRLYWNTALTAGYVQMAYAAIGINPFALPDPPHTGIDIQPIDLSDGIGMGWRLTLRWPELLPVTSTSPAVGGFRQLAAFYEEYRDRPVFCFVDTAGKNLSGVFVTGATGGGVSEALRGGVMIMRSFTASMAGWISGVVRYSVELVVETWPGALQG